jgi:hypothetical protein
MASRTRWEAFVTNPIGPEYHSEELRALALKHQRIGEARGEARGLARGLARAILNVLDGRGVVVSLDIREQVLACTDLSQLHVWLDRSFAATSLADVVD